MRGVDDLVTQASERTGLDDLGAPTWREGLEVLVDAAAHEARLNEHGHAVLEGYCVERLANRQRVIDWAARHPGAAGAPVVAPWFVVGMSRTGTTLLANLLHQDRANRCLMYWEALDSIPPPDGARFDDDPRVAPARALTDAMYAGMPHLRAQHYEPGDGPTECGLVLGQDFRCLDAMGIATLPAYGAWLLGADFRPAYEYHRLVLAVLQSAAPGQWVGKSPQHMLSLDAIDATYPDARFVFTHRDPIEAVGSTAKLVHTASTILGEGDQRHAIGRWWLECLATGAERMVAFADRAEGGVGARAGGSGVDDRSARRIVHVAYPDLVADPIGTLGRIYRAFGRELTDDVAARMAAWLAENPQGRWGPNPYRLEDYGLPAGEVRERFAAYCARFGVEADRHGPRHA